MLRVTGTIGSRTFRVLWALEELGLEFEHRAHAPQSEPVWALNPLGQVPILEDGDAVLTDSLAILHYLADRAGKLTYPAGTVERAHMDARINFVLTEMEAPLWLMARHRFVLPEDQRIPGMREVAEADFGRGEAKFAKLIGDAEFFSGDSFTIADIIAGHVANWAVNAKVELKTTQARDYLSRMQARPAWSKARAEKG